MDLEKEPSAAEKPKEWVDLQPGVFAKLTAQDWNDLIMPIGEDKPKIIKEDELTAHLRTTHLTGALSYLEKKKNDLKGKIKERYDFEMEKNGKIPEHIGAEMADNHYMMLKAEMIKDEGKRKEFVDAFMNGDAELEVYKRFFKEKHAHPSEIFFTYLNEAGRAGIISPENAKKIMEQLHNKEVKVRLEKIRKQMKANGETPAPV